MSGRTLCLKFVFENYFGSRYPHTVNSNIEACAVDNAETMRFLVSKTLVIFVIVQAQMTSGPMTSLASTLMDFRLIGIVDTDWWIVSWKLCSQPFANSLIVYSAILITCPVTMLTSLSVCWRSLMGSLPDDQYCHF